LVFTHQGTQGSRPPISAHPPRHQPGAAPRPRGHRVIYQTLTKSAHPGGKKALAEIYSAEDKDHALTAAKAFAADYDAKWPKAVARITDDLDVLLAFYDYPAEHWIRLRTTNPIVILSPGVSRGCDLRRPVVDSVFDGTRAV